MLLLWAALGLQALAAAEPVPTCVKKTAKAAYREPADLKALMVCQKKKLTRSASDYQARRGGAPSEETVERWRELQRREVRDFIRRHPDRSVISGDPEPEARSAKVKPGQAEESPKAEPGQGEAEQAPPADLEALKKDLLEKSDQGRKGVTPEMAAEIVATLKKQQGSVSGDMAALLDAVQKDGPNLSAETFRRLQDATRKADASGLDLGVPPEIKESLLKDESESDQTAPAVRKSVRPAPAELPIPQAPHPAAPGVD